MNSRMVLLIITLFGTFLIAEGTLFRKRYNPVKSIRMTLVALVFLISLMVYFITLAPSFVGEDTAEYALQASKLGLAHGPGYFFYIVLGKLFSLPFGTNVSYAMNLLSAVFSAGTVALLFLLINRFGGGDRLAFFLSLQFAFIPEFWFQATKATPRNLCVTAGLLIFLWLQKWYDRGFRVSEAMIILFCSGLMVGFNSQVLFIVPAIFLFLLLSSPPDAKSWRWRLLKYGVSFLVGLGIVFIVVILKARQEPPLGTYYIPVVPRFLYYAFSGKEWHFGFIGVSNVLWNWLKMLKFAFFSLGGVGFLIALYGGWATIRTFSARNWFFLFLLGPLTALFNYAMQPHVYKGSFGQTNLFYACLILWSAAGYDHLCKKNLVKPFVHAWVFILPLLTMITAWIGFSQKVAGIPKDAVRVDNRSNLRWVESTNYYLERVPQGSILFTDWEQLTSIRYMQEVCGLRRDLQVFETRNGLWYATISIPVWKLYIKNNYRQKPVFVTQIDSDLLKFANLMPFEDNLWRVSEKSGIN